MHALSAADVIRIWELGQGQNVLERAITILAVAFPDTPREALSKLNLGNRNARLFQVREQLFGHKVDGFAECPRCSQRLEFALDAATLWGDSSLEPHQQGYDLAAGGFELQYRLPDSQDLTAAAACVHLEAARRHVAHRAGMHARQHGQH